MLISSDLSILWGLCRKGCGSIVMWEYVCSFRALECILQVPFLSLSSYSDILLIAGISRKRGGWNSTTVLSVPPCLCVFYAFVRYSSTPCEVEKYRNKLLSVSVNQKTGRDVRDLIWSIRIFVKVEPKKLHQHEPGKRHHERPSHVFLFVSTHFSRQALMRTTCLVKPRHWKHEDGELCQQCGPVYGSSRWRLWSCRICVMDIVLVIDTLV